MCAVPWWAWLIGSLGVLILCTLVGFAALATSLPDVAFRES